MIEIKVGIDFSDDPSGRYYTDGDGSGEEFREEVLKPLLYFAKEHSDKVKINIDENVEGYGSSFLVEAFSGLVRNGDFSANELKELLVIECELADFNFYKKKIYQYIDNAIWNSKNYISTKEKAIEGGQFKDYIDKSFVKKKITKNG